MTPEEKQKLIELINFEVEQGNIKELKEIKTYIQTKLSSINESELDQEQKEVLIQTIPEFFVTSFAGEEKKGFKYVSLCNAIGRAKHLKSGPIRVYNALGLDYDILTLFGFNGIVIWNKFESKLNEFGLSTKKNLSLNQIGKLERLCKKPKLVVTDKSQRIKKNH